MEYETIIGLEVHVQLNTKSKLFSNAPTEFGKLPNSQANYVDAALPGTLPVLNEDAVKKAITFGLAINAEINNDSYFERKNYFYPDLPKGYQISQFKKPIVGMGYLDINLDTPKKIEIVRAHLEEDAGKSLHSLYPNTTGIDLNRAGSPLLEIVTSPCINNADEAVAYLKALHELVKFIGICDGNMQEGSFRCDVNISLRPKGEQKLGVRTEIKNLNSFKFIKSAILYEQERHTELLESSQKITQETRLYNPDKNITLTMRSKEEEQDYRYFQDPDLLPIKINEALFIEIKNKLPPLPQEIRASLADEGIQEDAINLLLADKANYDFFIEISNHTKALTKDICNWMRALYNLTLNERKLSFQDSPINAATLAILLNRIMDKSLNNAQAKAVLAEMLNSHDSIDAIVKKLGFSESISENTLEEIITSLFEDNPKQVAELKGGKDKLLGFFVGQAMKKTKGKASPVEITRIIKTKLELK